MTDFGRLLPRRPILHEIASNQWRFGAGWPKAQPHSLKSAILATVHPPGTQLRPVRFEVRPRFRRPTPAKVRHPVTFPTTSAPLARALAERHYDSPTPVQTAVLADAAADRDLLVSAQTGSGKTVAYGLAIARNLLEGAERFAPAAAPLALIVAPTRELALQVHRELAWLLSLIHI